MISKTIFVVTVSFFCVHIVQSQMQLADIFTSVSSPKLCATTISNTCDTNSGCAIGYNMFAEWRTDLPSFPTDRQCYDACDEHVEDCKKRCQYLTNLKSRTSTQACTCILDRVDDLARARCKDSCYAMDVKCSADCIAQTKCPYKAQSTNRWDGEAPGKCVSSCQ